MAVIEHIDRRQRQAHDAAAMECRATRHWMARQPAPAEAVGNMADYVSRAAEERDRLRAVVDVVRVYVPMIEAADADVDQQERFATHLELLRRLRRLDGSEVTDGTDLPQL